jgi:hypothetical protein
MAFFVTSFNSGNFTIKTFYNESDLTIYLLDLLKDIKEPKFIDFDDLKDNSNFAWTTSTILIVEGNAISVNKKITLEYEEL